MDLHATALWSEINAILQITQPPCGMREVVQWGRDLGQVCVVVLYTTPCSTGEMLQACRAGRWMSGASQAVHSPGVCLWGPLVSSFFLGGLRCWFNVMRFPCLQSFQKLLSNLNIPQLSALSYKTENNLVIYLFKLCCCFLICCHCQWYSQSWHFFSAFALGAWGIIDIVWLSTYLSTQKLFKFQSVVWDRWMIIFCRQNILLKQNVSYIFLLLLKLKAG